MASRGLGEAQRVLFKYFADLVTVRVEEQRWGFTIDGIICEYAQVSFNESYLSARGHKAFATSPSGGWGWAATRRSPNEAARDALLDCETRRPTYTAPCVLVNVNGQWAQGQ